MNSERLLILIPVPAPITKNLFLHGVQKLEKLGIVAEMTGQKKNRSYSYQAYVELLSR